MVIEPVVSLRDASVLHVVLWYQVIERLVVKGLRLIDQLLSCGFGDLLAFLPRHVGLVAEHPALRVVDEPYLVLVSVTNPRERRIENSFRRSTPKATRAGR